MILREKEVGRYSLLPSRYVDRSLVRNVAEDEKNETEGILYSAFYDPGCCRLTGK